MRQNQRSLVVLVILGSVLFLVTGILAFSAQVHAAGKEGAADIARLAAGQKPRYQERLPGATATFTVGITNTGTVSITTISLSEAAASSCNTGGLGPLAPGQSLSFACEQPNLSASFLNDILVTAAPAGGGEVKVRTDAFVKVIKPGLRILKSPLIRTVPAGGIARFTVVVFNTSAETILTEVKVDDTVADCDRDPLEPAPLGPGQSRDYLCSLSNVQAPITTIATVQGRDEANNVTLTDSAVSWVNLARLQATLVPTPTAVDEPGGVVSYQVTLLNGGNVPLTLRELTSNLYGDLFDPANSLVAVGTNTCPAGKTAPPLPPGDSFNCSFEGPISGQPGTVPVTVKAVGRSPDNVDTNTTGAGNVTINDLPSSISISLGADPPFINPPGRNVTYNIRIDNTSAADNVTITALIDDILGSLNGKGSCSLPVASIAPGFSYQCSFSTLVQGQEGEQVSRTITATGFNDDDPPEIVSDEEIITVGITQQATSMIFMPNVADDVVRDSCVRAYPLSLNRSYRFLPPARGSQSVFKFTLTTTTPVRVELTDFVPRAGQLVVWSGDCGGLIIAGRNTDTALNKTVNLGQRPPGNYVIQLINDGPSNNRDTYGLIVRTN